MLESVEHSLLLKDGRTLAYHTFPAAGEKKLENDDDDDVHPVLYFHGYPGCGLEAGIACAPSVARAGGRIYAIDRPGMGKTSSPYNTKAKADDVQKDMAQTNLETFVDNVWELIQDQGWKEFSVIGVSGGGPFTLALLASYLERQQSCSAKESNRPARLCNVSLVGAACFSAGTDGMKPELAQLVQVVEKAQTSRWYRFLLGATAASTGPMYNYLIPAMPLSWTKYLISLGNASSPPADRDYMSVDENLRPFLVMMGSMVAQGGYPGAYDDGMILMRKGQPHEEVLRKAYSNLGTKGDDNDDGLPAIGIFQGESDVNVHPSHARYLHESIFHKRSTYFGYDGLGHESMIMGKSEDYAAFATAARTK